MTSVDPNTSSVDPIGRYISSDSETLEKARDLINHPDKNTMQKKLSYKETVYKVVLAQKKILNNALFFSSLFGGCCALAGALLPTFPSPSIKAGLIAGVVIGVPVGVLRANIDLAMELRETENRARELSNQRLAMASLITEQHRCLGVGIPRPPSRSETENLNGD